MPHGHASHYLNMLAEAAHVGNHSKQFVEVLVRNAYGYFQHSMMPIMDKMEHCMEMNKLDEEVVDAVDALLDRLDNVLT